MILFALTTAWLLGALLVAQGWPRAWPLRRDLAILLPLGFLVGVGATSVIFFVASLWLPRPLYAAALEWAVLLVLAASVGRRWIRETVSVATLKASWIDRVLGFVFVQLVVVAVIMGWRVYRAEPFGGWDGWAIWNMHARFMLRAGTQWPELLTAGALSWTHPDYPRLLPGSVARLWAWAGEEAPGAAALLSIGFGAATVALLVSVVVRLRGRVVGLIGGIVLLATPFFVTFSANEHADIPVGAYMLAAVAMLVLANHSPGAERVWLLAGLCAGWAAWTKNEGQLFAGSVGAALAIHCWRHRMKRAGGFFAAGLGLGLAVVVYFKLRWAPPNDLMSVAGNSPVGHLFDGSRHATILAALGRDLGGFGEWRIAPWIALALPLLAWRSVRRLREVEWMVPVVLGCMLLGYYGVYLISSQDLSGHLDSSLVRLLLQLWPTALLLWCLVTPGVETETRSADAPQPRRNGRTRGRVVFLLVNGIGAAIIVATLSAQRAKDEFAARRLGWTTASVIAGDGWFPREKQGGDEWAWSSGRAKLKFYSGKSAGERAITLRFALASAGARMVVIRDGARELWRGEVKDQQVPVVLRDIAVGPAGTEIEFSTDTPGEKESAAAGGRTLAFAIFNPRLE